jgi:hypothetical protein
MPISEEPVTNQISHRLIKKSFTDRSSLLCCKVPIDPPPDPLPAGEEGESGI